MKYTGTDTLKGVKKESQKVLDKALEVVTEALVEMNGNMEDIDAKVSSPLSYNAEAETLTLFGSSVAASEEG